MTPDILSDPPELLADLDRSVKAINSVVEMLESQGCTRTSDPEWMLMPEPDACGVCGERQTRFYNTLDGIPICGPCKGAR